MKINRIRAIAWKEVLQIRRDVRSILIVVAMPVILMLAFGYGVSFDIKHLPTYVFDRENSQQSRDLIQRFRSSEYFRRAQVGGQLPRSRPRPSTPEIANSAIVIPSQLFAEAARRRRRYPCRQLWMARTATARTSA